jgi:hypothetical protein
VVHGLKRAAWRFAWRVGLSEALRSPRISAETKVAIAAGITVLFSPFVLSSAAWWLLTGRRLPGILGKCFPPPIRVSVNPRRRRRPPEERIRRDLSTRALNAAVNTAQRDVSDDEALAALRVELADVPPPAISQTADGWSHRDDYVHDRALRLIIALRDGTTVEPVPAANRAQFEREAVLGRLPLPDAFSELAAAEPRLRDLERPGRRGKLRAIQKLVGRKSKSPDPVMRGEIALYIACAHLYPKEPSPKPLFERKRYIQQGTIGFDPEGAATAVGYESRTTRTKSSP